MRYLLYLYCGPDEFRNGFFLRRTTKFLEHVESKTSPIEIVVKLSAHLRVKENFKLLNFL